MFIVSVVVLFVLYMLYLTDNLKCRLDLIAAIAFISGIFLSYFCILMISDAIISKYYPEVKDQSHLIFSLLQPPVTQESCSSLTTEITSLIRFG